MIYWVYYIFTFINLFVFLILLNLLNLLDLLFFLHLLFLLFMCLIHFLFWLWFFLFSTFFIFLVLFIFLFFYKFIPRSGGAPKFLLFIFACFSYLLSRLRPQNPASQARLLFRSSTWRASGLSRLRPRKASSQARHFLAPRLECFYFMRLRCYGFIIGFFLTLTDITSPNIMSYRSPLYPLRETLRS